MPVRRAEPADLGCLQHGFDAVSAGRSIGLPRGAIACPDLPLPTP